MPSTKIMAAQMAVNDEDWKEAYKQLIKAAAICRKNMTPLECDTASVEIVEEA